MAAESALSRLLRWLWSGHRHSPMSTVLVPLLAADAERARLVEADRCSCGAVRPHGDGWMKP